MAILTSHPVRYMSTVLLGMSLFLGSMSPALAAPEAKPVVTYTLVQQPPADPLKGMDLQRLETEKQQLSGRRASAETATLLSIVPGVGHMYAGQGERGAWVLGGFAATLILSFLGSYLLSSIDSDIARTAAVVVNVAPPSAYLAWGATDAYYQTTLSNAKIDQQIRDITDKQKEYGYYSHLFRIHF